MFLILWKELIFLSMCRCTCRWSFIFQYHRVISRALSCTYVIRGHFQVPVPCKRSEGIGSFGFFSSPLKDNFMLMKNAAKESNIQRSPRSTRKELCSDVLSVMATVLCTPTRPGYPSLCWTKGLWTWDFSLLPLWSPSLTASWSRDSRTALADIWYLSCASNYDQNPSHDEQPQLCCSSPGSFQGEGITLTAWPQTHG